MPVTTTVTTSDTGTGTTVGATMEDTGGPGGKNGTTADVVFVADAALVGYDSATPVPFDKKITGKSIELRWKTKFTKATSLKKFKVKLKCKGKHGPTCYAWTITTDKKSKSAWNASIGTLYHGHPCRKRRGKKSKG